MAISYNIGIDIGGTHIKAAVVDSEYNIVFRAKCETSLPKTGDQIKKDIENLIDELFKETNLTIKDIENIGIGCPGIINTKTKIIEYSCNLNFFEEKFISDLQKKYDKLIYIENDANVAALGEYIYRMKKGDVLQDMILLTLGTGIGGGIIIDGKLYRGFNFAGAEIGHMVIKKNGRACNCGRKGCFETYASATGLVKTTEKVMKKYKKSILWDFLKNGGKLSGKTAFKAARQKDKAAAKVVDKFLDDLAVGVANIVNIFQPNLIVIGGGLSKEGNMLEEPLNDRIKELDYAKNLKNRCKIEISKIGNDAGLIGASNLYKFQ